MAALHPLVAARAASNGHLKPAIHRLDLRNFSLILLGRPDEFDTAAACGTGRRQRRFVNFVDARRHGAESFRAVVVTALAAGRPGIELGRSLGKRRVRTVLLAPQFLDQRGQFFHLRGQFLDLLGLRLYQRQQPHVFCTQRVVHAKRIVSLRSKNERNALNNYQIRSTIVHRRF